LQLLLLLLLPLLMHLLLLLLLHLLLLSRLLLLLLCLQDLPLGKVKGLGGKLGQQLEALGASTAGAAAGLAYEALLAHFRPKDR
jgi:hypothetical protein